jgi:hypothetical protein
MQPKKGFDRYLNLCQVELECKGILIKFNAMAKISAGPCHQSCANALYIHHLQQDVTASFAMLEI